MKFKHILVGQHHTFSVAFAKSQRVFIFALPVLPPVIDDLRILANRLRAQFPQPV